MKSSEIWGKAQGNDSVLVQQSPTLLQIIILVLFFHKTFALSQLTLTVYSYFNTTIMGGGGDKSGICLSPWI
jgi:hypothetical protein